MTSSIQCSREKESTESNVHPARHQTPTTVHGGCQKFQITSTVCQQEWRPVAAGFVAEEVLVFPEVDGLPPSDRRMMLVQCPFWKDLASKERRA